MPAMDYHDIQSIQERALLVQEIHDWNAGKIDPEILNAALDAVPDDQHTGFVVVWVPYREGDYVAKLCFSRLGVAWYTWRARCQKSLFSFVFDLGLAYADAWNREPTS